MHRRYRPALDRRCQRRPMSFVQTRRLTRRLAIDQSIRAIRVELQHPVPDDLSRHPTNFRRLGTRRPLIDCRKRQQSAHLIGVLALARRYTDTRRVIIRAQRNWHGETPRFASLESDPPRVGEAPRVRLSKAWYKPAAHISERVKHQVSGTIVGRKPRSASCARISETASPGGI